MTARNKRIPYQPLDVSSFRWGMLSNTQVRIGVGALSMDGLDAWELAAQTVTLSDDTAFVYIRQNKANREDITIAATTVDTYPKGQAGESRWALYKFVSTDGGASYCLERDCRADIRLGAPV